MSNGTTSRIQRAQAIGAAFKRAGALNPERAIPVERIPHHDSPEFRELVEQEAVRNDDRDNYFLYMGEPEPLITWKDKFWGMVILVTICAGTWFITWYFDLDV